MIPKLKMQLREICADVQVINKLLIQSEQQANY